MINSDFKIIERLILEKELAIEDVHPNDDTI